MAIMRGTRPEGREATEALVRRVGQVVRPLEGDRDLDPLLECIGDARYVLLGEASHGTSEYYTWRARLSQRLITEKGFSFIAVEGDWPDCYRVNRYIKGKADCGSSAREVLHAYYRWPTWMWANEEIVNLTEWLHGHNRQLPDEQKVGFYGLDVYSLWDSLEAILDYVKKEDGSAVDAALQAFRCFQPYAEDPQEYAMATMMVPRTCEDAVVRLLGELREQAPGWDDGDREAFFCAEQNALVARNAERYYRTMVRGGGASWNVRDTHMAETLERLMQHHGPDAKAIVWEHNTHIGDARATDMADAGMVNTGQLVREAHAPEDVVLVGFGSYGGSVIAGSSWGAPMQAMPVPDAEQDSWEDVLHRVAPQNHLLIFDHPDQFADWRSHRAIGVVYNPAHERLGNYVPSRLSRRYDAFLYIDRSHALHPLHLEPQPSDDMPDTFPSGV